MYFEIQNTPEHIRRLRRTESVLKELPEEECPLLVLAPFSRPPRIVFDNVLVGTSCERNLVVFNPLKQVQKITLGRRTTMPSSLEIYSEREFFVLEPNKCLWLTMEWKPSKPTGVRETIRFTNGNRGRYGVIVVLKSIANIKGKGVQPKGFKIASGEKKKKPTKESPVALYKKKSEIIYNLKNEDARPPPKPNAPSSRAQRYTARCALLSSVSDTAARR